MTENITPSPDQDPESDPNKLEVVGRFLVPAERAEQERDLLKRDEELLKKYGNSEEPDELVRKVEEARYKLDAWIAENPQPHEYLTSIETWKRGWNPMLGEDEVNAKKAEERMRGIESGLDLQEYKIIIRLIHHPEDELIEIGYSSTQISFIQALGKGAILEGELVSAQKHLNYVRSLIRRKR